jgi:hypothetical protein
MALAIPSIQQHIVTINTTNAINIVSGNQTNNGTPTIGHRQSEFHIDP